MKSRPVTIIAYLSIILHSHGVFVNHNALLTLAKVFRGMTVDGSC